MGEASHPGPPKPSIRFGVPVTLQEPVMDLRVRRLSPSDDPMIFPTQVCGFNDHVPFQGMHREITPTLLARSVQICDAGEI